MIVYLNNFPVGKIETQEEERQFTYHSGYLNRPDALPLSLSLPLDAEPYSEKFSKPFFDLISPDIWYSEADLDLSCIGAISFKKAEPSCAEFAELDAADCEAQLNGHLVALPDDRLVSIADLQPMLPISIIDGELFQATEDIHNTHILKGNIGELDDLVGNEIFVSLIAYNLGIPVPMISRIHLGETPALVMDRPDRHAPATAQQLGAKIHHESFISALSNQFLGSRKNHQISVEGQFELVRHHAITPALDCRTLIRVLALCLISGCDDFSLENQLIEILPHNTCKLAPVAGFISSEVYPNTVKNLLDYLFSIQHFSALKKSHLNDLARKIRVNDKYLNGVISDLCSTVPKISKEIFESFPSLKSPITLKIAKLIDQRSMTLKTLISNKGQMTRKVALNEAV
ncbi:MAG: HipA domain-containing protein [Candidatus Paracaedibacteraceae bacterium]|nr:HipA domain-containing protein [Candidatus Paracaedibacteraceae bacterium]